MLYGQKIFAIIASSLLLLLIVELVRRRKMREEYSFLWIVTGVMILVLTVWYDLLVALTHLIGAVLPTTTLFIFGMIFLVLILIHFSIRISDFASKIEELAQEVAMLRQRVGEP